MDPYLTSLAVGAVGLGAMAVGGLGGRGHHAAPAGRGGSGPSGGHVGHGAGHGPAAGVGHGAHASHGHAGVQARSGAGARSGPGPGGIGQLASRTILAATSPRFLFSYFVGFGATGLLLRPVLASPLLFAVAVAGAVVFERVLVSPLWNLSMRFASKPAVTLESAVTDEATAVTAFDSNGQGIVSLELDGQIVQLLATLQSDDRLLGTRIRAGQRVRIEEVDAEQNRCTVSLV